MDDFIGELLDRIDASGQNFSQRAYEALSQDIEPLLRLLLSLVDGEDDGDAAFFSRDLVIAGNTEAVVSLRNALDDVEGSIAQETADLFGSPGRAVLAALRRRASA